MTTSEKKSQLFHLFFVAQLIVLGVQSSDCEF